MKDFRILLVALALFLHFPMTRAGGLVVNNGGGIAENTILFAWTKVRDIMRICHYSSTCQLSAPENEILGKILYAMDAEYRGGGPKFESGNAKPGFFEVEDSGKIRTAVTGNSVGDPIYFNLDLIYGNTETRNSAMTWGQALSILVHELGHHHGIKDHAWLDRIGSKIRAQSESFSEELNLGRIGFKHIQFQSINPGLEIHSLHSFGNQKDLANFSFSNNVMVLDLTHDLAQNLKCSALNESPTASIVSNLHWGRFVKMNPGDLTQELLVKANVDYKCPSGVFSAELQLKMHLEPKEIQSWGPQSSVVDFRYDPVHSWTLHENATLDATKASLQWTLSNLMRLEGY